MNDIDHFVGVDFHRFKGFEQFSIELRAFNVLVGPNNAGKSTILAAFRILSAAIRRAESRKAEMVRGPNGAVYGHKIELGAISVAEENLFYNYDDDEAAWVRFRLSSGNSLLLYFPEREVCYLIPDAHGRPCSSPATFKKTFKCSIGFVPILGPVDHNEKLFEKEAARLALFNYRAARNFRNIWRHFPEHFETFRGLIVKTWPGMDVLPPEVDMSHKPPRLYMWCPENRKPREIFWAGFGFQVWCQMLTHIIQSKDVSLFLIDEPDIYLHSDLQRRLLGILKSLGPDILIATHSTEIVTEADTDEIVVVDRRRKRAFRIRNSSQLESVFRDLGSGINPVLTQLAKTRRVLFVEGTDFQILGRFARKLGFERVASRTEFAVVPVEGFNPERMRTLKDGMQKTLGTTVAAAAILDRDYRSDGERHAIAKDCQNFCDMAVVHDCKEIENFLLVPDAIDRAAGLRVADRARRSGTDISYLPVADSLLDQFADTKRSYVMSQYLTLRKRYEREISSGLFEETLNQQEIERFDLLWTERESRFRMIPGKEALSFVNKHLQDKFSISITPASIIEVMRVSEVPNEAARLIQRLETFVSATKSDSAE